MSDLEQKLRQHFGFDQFRPRQQEIITALLAGESAVGVLPTGGGKSICYQLPALLLPGVTIVISPLISLMKDQTDSLVARGISALALNSHDTPAEGRSKLKAIERGEVKLVFVAPERLQNPAFLAACRRVTISLLAVDEAHCVSQWGHDFRPDYQQIPAFHQRVGQPPLLALTATARPAVQDDLARQLDIPTARRFRDSADRPNLWIGLETCHTAAEREAVMAHLLREQPGSAVIYATSRREAEALADSLGHRLGEPVACYHAGMGAEARTAVQNQFMTDLVRVVVATNAFGMGIDKPNVRTVLHAGVPDSLEAYFQELGRAGRDGLPSRCVMVLIPGRDVKLREFLVRQSGAPHAFARFRQMCSYVYATNQCRRTLLLDYFGEHCPPQAAACCSTCHPLTIPDRVEMAVATADRRRRRRAGKEPSRAAATPAPGPLPASGTALLEHLKQWRRRQAAAQGVPAFVIFGDRDLAGLAAAAPADLMALSACRGVGPTKLQLYGAELLAAIAGFAQRPQPEPEAKPAAKPDRSALLAQTGALFGAGWSAAAIATAIARSEATVWQYLEEWVGREPTTAWKQAAAQVLSRAAYREITAALRAQADRRLQPVFEGCGGRYTYEQIRVARAVQARHEADRDRGQERR